MLTGAIGFEPLLPLWVLALLTLPLVAGVAIALWRARRIAPARLIVAVLSLLLLAGPVRREEERETSPAVAVALVDRSASMSLGDRRGEVKTALARLRSATPGVSWRTVEIAGSTDGTDAGPALDQALRDVRADQLAGVVMLTDGIVRDRPPPSLVPADRPFHLLLAGDPALRDRRLVVQSAPAYTVVGQQAEIRVEIDDGPEKEGARARLEWQVNGSLQPAIELATGRSSIVRVPVERRGPVEVALSVAPMTGGEATLVNNRALVRLNGVRDRLRVLLVSGVPYPGGRVWRDILKSDANIDLVHFTILRLPSSFDPTPGSELSLIPFPVEELFERRLDGFDLVIFDRFGLTELLSQSYFSRLAQHVREGGGTLVIAGPEYSQPGSIAETALGGILPGLPAGAVLTSRYVPALTSLGRRHPVTSVLPSSWGGEDWGAWAEQAPVTPVRDARVLMTGNGGRPLLMLDSAGRGRVALLASTQVWWWARAVAGGGPREELLRRLSHWLMQEPDLDTEQLRVTAAARRLDIRAQGLEPPGQARVTGPDGGSWTVPLGAGEAGEEGVATGSLDVPADGLYRVTAGRLTRFVLAGDTAELSEVRPRAAPLAALAGATGGGTWWLKDGMPEVRLVAPGDRKQGSGWLGLVRGEGGRLLAIRTEPLLPGWLALLMISAALAFAWWRERR